MTRRGEQWYAYNSLGQMDSAWEKGRFSVRFFYDDRGRLVAKKDHKRNTVQFVYANPLSNSTVTHVNYPVAERTIRYQLFSGYCAQHLDLGVSVSDYVLLRQEPEQT